MRVDGRRRRLQSLWTGTAAGALLLLFTAAWPGTAASAQALEMAPGLPGPWVADAGVIQLNVMHRFRVLDPPSRKVLNTPTFLLGAGVGRDAMVALRYATSSLLVRAEPNEWEAYGRWRALRQEAVGLDVSARAGWNGTAESVDGELSFGRDAGPVRLLASGRAFSAWRGGDAALAVAAGAVWQVHRWAAVAADVARQLGDEPDPLGWSAGLQLRIPYSPHTLSLHVTNVNATTLQSSTVGLDDRRLWGFEFTVPISLNRYFGGRAPSAPASRGPEAARTRAPADTVVVGMDNRLRFLPDTVRVSAGTAVRWVNGSDLVHTVTADPERVNDPGSVRLPAGADPFDSGDMVPGDEYVRVFTVPGTYQYVCLPHERAGMVGVVIVTPDD